MYKNESLFNCVFSKESTIQFGDDTLEKIDLGELNLPTGKIVATDPLTCFNPEPYAAKIAPGKYSASVFIKGSIGRNALLALFFNDKPAVLWDMAVVKGQKKSTLPKDGYFYIAVDGGVGSFMDYKTYEIAKNAAGDGVLNAIIDDNNANYTLVEEDFIGKEKTLKFEPDLNVVMCDSGWGDGTYPSYFGIAEDGQPCCLVMDFMLFLDQEEDESETGSNEQSGERINHMNCENDISMLDAPERPFLFFGAGMAFHFEYAWLQIKFVSAPEAKAIGKIVKAAPKILGVKKDEFCGSILPVLCDYPINVKIERAYGDPKDKKALARAADEGCSIKTQLAFEQDIIRWLLEIHTFFPIEYVVRSEDAEAGGIKFSNWHYASLKEEDLLKVLATDATKCTDDEKKCFDEMVDTITDYWMGSEWGDGNEDAKWIRPDRYASLLLKYKKFNFLDSAVAENMQNKPYLTQILKAMNDFIESNYNHLGSDIYWIYRHIITNLPDSAFTENAEAISKIVQIAYEEKDSEFLTLIARKITDFANRDEITYQIYEDACDLKDEKDFERAVPLHLYIFSLIDVSGPLRTADGREDYSIYNNMLYILQNDNSQLPVNPELNRKCIEACLPHGKRNPGIYFNVACLYTEMNEFDNALKMMKIYFASSAQRKNAMLEQVKTLEMFDAFKKHPGVMEYVDSLEAVTVDD